MKNYKTFFIKTFIIFLISIIVIPTALIFWIDFMVGHHNYSKTADYVHFLITQKREKASEYDKLGNKIVVVSGSNTLYGLNSKEIYEKTKLPVVNFGIHAGFEHYIFNEAEKILKSGDIVILPLEYSLYKEDSKTVPAQLAEYIVSYGKDYMKELTPIQKLGLSFYLIKLIITYHSLEAPPLDENTLSQTNEFGDFIANKGIVPDIQNNRKYVQISQNIPTSNKNFSLYNFIQFCQKNNIKLYATTPCIYHTESFTEKEIQDFEIIKNFYKTNNVEFIGDYNSGTLKDEKLIYDFGYHANDAGQEIRTNELLKLIQSII
ncbi:MAG: hypothetical protein ACI37Z_09560 [Candidatus Gastranaerophilaceae bacterium]